MKLTSITYSLLIGILLLVLPDMATAQSEGTITINSSEKIKQIIQQKKDYNKNLRKVKGFRVQIFFGNEKGAYKARDEFAAEFPDVYIRIENFPPDWKVRVGNYKTQLEADRALEEIKALFPGALVIPEMINIQ